MVHFRMFSWKRIEISALVPEIVWYQDDMKWEFSASARVSRLVEFYNFSSMKVTNIFTVFSYIVLNSVVQGNYEVISKFKPNFCLKWVLTLKFVPKKLSSLNELSMTWKKASVWYDLSMTSTQVWHVFNSGMT